MAFFEQLGKKISDAGQGASQQAKNFADVTRLNSAISDKEKRITQLYAEIGQFYYEKHRDDPQADTPDRIAAITALNAEIKQHREEIKQIKGITKCPNCGADVPLNAAFCNSCGTKMPVEAPAQAAPVDPALLCPNCQKPIIPGNQFCIHCGAKLPQSDQ